VAIRPFFVQNTDKKNLGVESSIQKLEYRLGMYFLIDSEVRLVAPHEVLNHVIHDVLQSRAG
jgi:hypothetical protein